MYGTASALWYMGKTGLMHKRTQNYNLCKKSAIEIPQLC